MLGAALGGFLGLPFGLPGIVLGSFLGAVAGDFSQRKGEWQALLKSGSGAALGVVLALILRLAILAVMALVLTGIGLWRLAA